MCICACVRMCMRACTRACARMRVRSSIGTMQGRAGKQCLGQGRLGQVAVSSCSLEAAARAAAEQAKLIGRHLQVLTTTALHARTAGSARPACSTCKQQGESSSAAKLLHAAARHATSDSCSIIASQM